MLNKKIILMFFISALLISLVNAQSSSCGYTCGANACTQQCTIPECPLDTPPIQCPPPQCECVGDCVMDNPALVYNSACGGTFDWATGNLNSIPTNVLVQNMDKIGDRFSELDDAHKQAVVNELIKKYNLPAGSIDISACTTSGSNPLSCGVSVDANGNIVLQLWTTDANGNPISIDLYASQLQLSAGASITATTGPPPSWQFNIPANGEINYGGVILKSTDGGTVTWDGTKATLSQGTSLTYKDPNKGTTTTVFAKQGNVDVYFGTNVPDGKTGVAINAPASNGDGVQIRGVIVAVAHTTADGQTIGIITDRIGSTEEVVLKRQQEWDEYFKHTTYELDLTKAGNSNVKFTDGYEGLTYDAGAMFQCNQAVGSCPYDTKTDISLVVHWNGPGGTVIEGIPGSYILVQGQSGITGGNIVVCPCDTTVPCNSGCVCDMICGLCDPVARPQQSCLPEWMWITFGYANYLKCTKSTSTIKCMSADDCCQAYGAPSKPVAFTGRADVCEIGQQQDTCGNWVTCKEDSKRRCFNPNTCTRQDATYCEKSCGYCNKQPQGKDVTLVTNISQPIQNIHYANYIDDEHSETATYEITSQSNPSITNCAVTGSLCYGHRLISNLTIQCSTPQVLGSTTLTININDECGASILAYLTISVINATQGETLGISTEPIQQYDILPVNYTAVYKRDVGSDNQIWVATRINPSTIILLAWAEPLSSTDIIWRSSNSQTIIASETASEIYLYGVLYDSGVPADTYGASKEGSVWLTKDKLYLAWEGQAKVEHATRVGFGALPARYTKEWCGQNTICAKSSELYDEWDGWPGFYVPLKQENTDEAALMGIGPWLDPSTSRGGFGAAQGYIYNHGTYKDFHGYDATQCTTWTTTLGLCNSSGSLHHANADHNLKAVLTGASAQWWSDSNNDHVVQCSEFGASGSNLPSTIYPHGMSVQVTDGNIPTRSEQSWAGSTEGECVFGAGTIQVYKVPDTDSTISSQTVCLDGGRCTTANPYFFTNVSKGTWHTVSVTVPAGWSVGYTVCNDYTGCHNNTPTPGSSVTTQIALYGNFTDIWWHYNPS